MLELRDITKAYTTASLTQVALDGISVSFRDNEFVAVLGQSGSGKTTMLNVVGGLDHFDSGDLVIDGISTRDFRDRDWDSYRNNRIGFVFQSYNLIPHQSVLANVELALTLSGVSRAERRERARTALEEVGLADHVHKRPAQLSGGQMQRVAIARALVNDPEILLADEPTGALDSTTSIQVMDLLREVASDRLVVMVTHNPDLAKRYATRVVELADGQIVSDSHPFDPGAEQARAAKSARATSMSALTALALSFNNLMTKKGRTLMTAFAGSIGIIGIAAILALANGVNDYIAQTEEDALTSYPLSIQSVGMDMAAMMAAGPPGADDADSSGSAAGGTDEGAGGSAEGGTDDDASGSAEGGDAADTQTVRTHDSFSTMMASSTSNDLASLRTYLEDDGANVSSHVSAIEYYYDVTPQVYLSDTSTGVVQVHPDQALAPMGIAGAPGPFASMMSMESFQQMPQEESLYIDQYDVQAGRWPAAEDELVLVLGERGRLPDLLEYTLGLRDHRELDALMQALQANEATGDVLARPSTDSDATGGSGDDSGGGPVTVPELEPRIYTYDELMAAELTLVDAADRYQHDENFGVWTDRSSDEGFMREVVDQGQPLRIVGIVQAKDSDMMTLRMGLAYPPALTERVVAGAAEAPIVQEQLANPEVDVFTGRTFEDLADGQDAEEFDMTSLFSIDTRQLQAAFRVDATQLQLDLDTLDLGGLQPPALDPGAMDLSGLDLSALDLSAMDLSADLAGLDTSAVSFDELIEQFPQLAEVDFPGIIAATLADGAIRPTAGEYLTPVVTDLVAGLNDYLREHAAQAPDPDGDGIPDIDTPVLVAQYLAQPEVQEPLREALTSEEVIDQELLIANLTEALGDDPAIAEISEAVRDQLVRVIGQQIGTALVANVQQALGQYLTQTIGAAMNQMMATMQQQIQQQMQQAMSQLASSMSEAMQVDEQAFADAFEFNQNPEELAALLATMMSGTATTFDSNLSSLGWADEGDPSQIDIFPASFEDKEAVQSILEDYNQSAIDRGDEDQVIVYTDLVGLLMSSVTQILDIITWMLIAFVSISLIVSSIMIAIITYISVLERKKEIGILRSVGASKRDISRVFNAETVIEGLLAGVMGVVITWLLTIPANLIVNANFGVERIAVLPLSAALILIAISVLLTVVAGLLPAAKAAREDPVEALRSE